MTFAYWRPLIGCTPGRAAWLGRRGERAGKREPDDGDETNALEHDKSPLHEPFVGLRKDSRPRTSVIQTITARPAPRRQPRCTIRERPRGNKMHAIIIGAGMGGLFSALALRESGKFDRVDVYEQTRTPSTAGAGLNIAPNGARLCKWLGIDLDGGDPKGVPGAIDGGRASILEATCQVMADNRLSRKPLDHDTAAKDGAGFHHMHRLDLLMCLYKTSRRARPGIRRALPDPRAHGQALEHALARRGLSHRDVRRRQLRARRRVDRRRRHQLESAAAPLAEHAAEALDAGGRVPRARARAPRSRACARPTARRSITTRSTTPPWTCARTTTRSR